MRNMKSIRCLVVSALAAMALSALPLIAAPVVREKKLLLTPRGENRRVTAADLAEPRARVVAAYEAMDVVAVPDVAWERVADRLAQAGFEVTELDDTIETPRRRITPGVDLVPKAPFAAGLFIVQYAAPPTGAWQASLRQSGVGVLQSLPGRAVLVSASAEQIASLTRLPWVEYAGPYLAEYKYAPLTTPDHTEFTIQIADTVASAGAVKALQARVGGFLTESRPIRADGAHHDERSRLGVCAPR